MKQTTSTELYIHLFTSAKAQNTLLSALIHIILSALNILFHLTQSKFHFGDSGRNFSLQFPRLAVRLTRGASIVTHFSVGKT